MHNIIFDKTKHVYNSQTKTFIMSERGIPFDTSYTITNPKTGKSMLFDFTHSTGPEFDPNTRWVYKSPDKTITLEVCNDRQMTKIAADAYLTAKLRK